LKVLMWSAYKGFPACVDVFLRWGASVHAKDEQGFTALHWALVKGSPGCIQKIIEYGADRFAKTTTGKTPSITARELNTAAAWHKALYECGYDEDANAVVPSWPGAGYFLQDRRGFTTKFFFLWPIVLIGVTLVIFAGMPVYAGVPLGFLAAYTIQWVGKQLLVYAPPDMRQFEKTVCVPSQGVGGVADLDTALDGGHLCGFVIVGGPELAVHNFPEHRVRRRCVFSQVMLDLPADLNRRNMAVELLLRCHLLPHSLLLHQIHG
jgi:palmitoyltransferase